MELVNSCLAKHYPRTPTWREIADVSDSVLFGMHAHTGVI